MKILLCHSILEREIRPLLKHFSKGDIKKAVLKISQGLGILLKPPDIKGTKLIKGYLTSRSGAGRMIVLVFLHKDYYLPVILRLKKDKLLGMNMGKENQLLHATLQKYLQLIKSDLSRGKYEEL